MKIHVTRNQWFLVSGIVLAIALSALYVQFAYISPLQLESKQLQQELKVQTALAAAQEKKKLEPQDRTSASDMLQKQLPSQPLVDQYVLDLEKAEGLSGVIIQNISIQETQRTSDASAANEAAAAPSQTIAMRWNIELKYDIYEQLQAFLKEIEDLPRVTVVKALDIKGREEMISPSIKEDSYTGTVILEMYYMPGRNTDGGDASLDGPPLCEDRTNPFEPQACE